MIAAWWAPWPKGHSLGMSSITLFLPVAKFQIACDSHGPILSLSKTTNMVNMTTQERIQSLLLQPAAKPPAGQASNLTNPLNLDGPVITMITLFITIAALAVLVRTYTKALLIRSLAYEDCESKYETVLQVQMVTVTRCYYSRMGIARPWMALKFN